MSPRGGVYQPTPKRGFRGDQISGASGPSLQRWWEFVSPARGLLTPEVVRNPILEVPSPIRNLCSRMVTRIWTVQSHLQKLIGGLFHACARREH